MLLKIFRKICDRLGISKFKKIGRNVTIRRRNTINNPGYIEVGDNVYIGPNSGISAIPSHLTQVFSPKIKIGNNVSATSMLQIYAVREIIIEDDVLIAANVFICDALHGYENGNIPYKEQDLFKISPIRIGRGSWIGQNAVILPGVTIGCQCIIGANSVVNSNIPDYSIAAGSPCKVLKTWDENLNEWVKV